MRENELSAWEPHDQFDVRASPDGLYIAMAYPAHAGGLAWYVLTLDGREVAARGRAQTMELAHERADTVAREIGWALQ